MSAIPIGKDGKRGESRRKKIDMLADSNDSVPDYQLPDKGALDYLVDYLSEIGEADTSGELLTQTTWQTIRAWAEMTQTQLTPGEFLALRSLSAAYVSQYYKSENPACFSPNINEPPSAQIVETKLKSLFAMLRGNK